MRWRDIRAACQAVGLPIEDWEEDFPERLLAYLVNHLPGGQERYLTEATFRKQVETVVTLVMACLMEHDPLTDPRMSSRVEELGDIFRSEAGLE